MTTQQRRTGPKARELLRDSHPEWKVEFRGVVDRPLISFDELASKSNHRVSWLCGSCSHAWVARVFARGACPRCSRAMAAERRLRPNHGRTVSSERPDLAAGFIDNLTRHGRGPDSLPPGSADVCRWTCRCGSELTRRVVDHLSTTAGCSACRPHGRSLLEVEVAHLLRAAGLTVEVDVRVGTGGRRRQVDLRLPDVLGGLLIDLDPHSTHAKQQARDFAKSRALPQPFLQVRETPLPPTPGLSVPVRAGRTSAPWAAAILTFLEERGVHRPPLSQDTTRRALRAAGEEWRRILASPPAPSAADAAPHLAGEFLANLTHPGMTLAWVPAGSNDRARWRCATCGHIWEGPVHTRTAGAGCSRCHARTSGQRLRDATRTRLGVAESLAQTHPDIAAEFVRCIDFPGDVPARIRPKSKSRCEWRCRSCSHVWEARVGDRVNGGGCPACWEAALDAAFQEGLDALDAFITREGHSNVGRAHLEGTFPLGEWASRRRSDYTQGRLRPDRRAALEGRPQWVWSMRDAAFRSGLAALATFVQREGHSVVPAQHREEGFPLGSWVAQRRRDLKAGRMSAERAAELEAHPGWVWAAATPRSANRAHARPGGRH